MGKEEGTHAKAQALKGGVLQRGHNKGYVGGGPGVFLYLNGE